jgi:hypothetical protein
VTGELQLGRNELEDRLRAFDRAVALLYPRRAFEMVLVGGGALVLLGCLARSTADLDALEVPSDLVPLLQQYDINCRVAAYVNNFAYNFRDRVVPLDLETEAVTFYAASLEDVVASKLHSARTLDEVDIRRPEVLEALDWAKLEHVIQDMRDSRMNDRRYSELVQTYRRYREVCGPCDR